MGRASTRGYVPVLRSCFSHRIADRAPTSDCASAASPCATSSPEAACGSKGRRLKGSLLPNEDAHRRGQLSTLGWNRWLLGQMDISYALPCKSQLGTTHSLFQIGGSSWRNSSARGGTVFLAEQGVEERFNTLRKCTEWRNYPRTLGRSAESSSIRGKLPSFSFYHLTLRALSSSFFCLPRVLL